MIKDALKEYLNEEDVLESKLSRLSEPEFEMFKANIDKAHSHLLHIKQIIEKEDKIRNEQKIYKGEAVWIVDKETAERDIKLTKLGEEKLEQRWNEYDEQSRIE